MLPIGGRRSVQRRQQRRTGDPHLSVGLAHPGDRRLDVEVASPRLFDQRVQFRGARNRSTSLPPARPSAAPSALARNAAGMSRSGRHLVHPLPQPASARATRPRAAQIKARRDRFDPKRLGLRYRHPIARRNTGPNAPPVRYRHTVSRHFSRSPTGRWVAGRCGPARVRRRCQPARMPPTRKLRSARRRRTRARIRARNDQGQMRGRLPDQRLVRRTRDGERRGPHRTRSGRRYRESFRPPHPRRESPRGCRVPDGTTSPRPVGTGAMELPLTRCFTGISTAIEKQRVIRRKSESAAGIPVPKRARGDADWPDPLGTWVSLAIYPAASDPAHQPHLARGRDHRIARAQRLDRHVTRRRANARAGAEARDVHDQVASWA